MSMTHIDVPVMHGGSCIATVVCLCVSKERFSATLLALFQAALLRALFFRGYVILYLKPYTGGHSWYRGDRVCVHGSRKRGCFSNKV